MNDNETKELIQTMDNDLSILSKYYQAIPKYVKNDRQHNFSHRFCSEKKYIIASKRIPNGIQKKIISGCPGPRMTIFHATEEGGNVYFPYSEKEKFLEQVTYDICSNTAMYWNQIAYEKEGCRFVIDIDGEREISIREIKVLARILHETLKSYYVEFENNPIRIYVCSCGPRLKKEKISTGVHMICHVNVTMKQAKQLRYGFVMRCKREENRCQLNLNGIDIDDVYKEKNKSCCLRMIYSNKIEKCPSCNGIYIESLSCPLCKEQGEVISKYTYKPIFLVDGTGNTENKDLFVEQCADRTFKKTVSSFSLWPEKEEDRTDYIKPINDPEYICEEKQENPKILKRKSTSKTSICTRSPAVTSVQNYIHSLTYMGMDWKGCNVSKVETTPSSSCSALIVIDGVDSRKCPYVGRTHNSNRIYFTILNGFLRVHCHSTHNEKCKESNRRNSKEIIQFEVPEFILEKLGLVKIYKRYKSGPNNYTLGDFTKKRNRWVAPKQLSKKEKHLNMLKAQYGLEEICKIMTK